MILRKKTLGGVAEAAPNDMLEVFILDRLKQDVIGAGRDCPRGKVIILIRGNHHDRQHRVESPNLAKHLYAVDGRQHEVEEDSGGQRFVYGLNGFESVARRVDTISQRLESIPQDLANVRIVIDYKQSLGHGFQHASHMR